MRNACDYRVSFDLTPYGDLAFLEAFGPDTTKTASTSSESGPGEAGSAETADAQFATVPFFKNFQADLRLTSASDPRSALKGYLVAASLATNFFSDMVSVVDIIDQSSLVRLSQCLVKSHDDAFFQYFWELPFLEMLVDLHSSPKYLNERHVTLLTNLIQSPELNSSNPAPVVKDAEQRVLRCYFRDLCRIYLGN
ncbi:hypothetical protein PR002_g27058 [Phytophthora rubi]|uniref:Uncharacterized protein n=1 Tax=Phytophthora rubi TaxID=129364 RepID=A0A6A3HLS9_9STRA|nr:hypothetical protein PR002_g27058 [Phytophthora rubi]